MSNAQKRKTLASRLARRHRKATPERFPHPASSPKPPTEDAASGHRKKSPALGGTIRHLAKVWTEQKHSNQRSVALHLVGLFGHLTPTRLRPEHISALMAHWKATLGRRTLWTYTFTLANQLEALGRPDLKDHLPRIPKPKPRTEIASPEELARATTTATGWLRCAILLAAHCGLRASDCLRCAPCHFNQGTGLLTITQQKTGDPITIPVSPDVSAILQSAPAADPTTPFVSAIAGSPVNYARLCAAWSKLRRRIALPPELTFHALRRTVAVGLYEVSKDLRIVQQALGHRSLSTTAAYLEHRDPAKLREVLSQLWTPKGPVQ